MAVLQPEADTDLVPKEAGISQYNPLSPAVAQILVTGVCIHSARKREV